MFDYGSAKWKQKREHILRRDKYICQDAKRYGRFVEAETVHHIFPAEYFPEYAWEDWNLISLSWKAHNEMHDRKTNELTKKGIELLRRTARKQRIDPPTSVEK